MVKIKHTKEDGTEEEIEVMSPEEVEQKLSEQKQEHLTKISELESNLNKLSEEKVNLEKKIGETKEDHPNFKALKEALDKKDSDIKALKDTVENDKKVRLQESMDAKIKIASKGDTEFEKKIKFHLSNTLSGMNEDTEESRQKKMEAAVKLSSDFSNEGPGIFDQTVGGGRGRDINGDSITTNTFSNVEKSIGAKLGITEDDYKKYGGRVSKR